MASGVSFPKLLRTLCREVREKGAFKTFLLYISYLADYFFDLRYRTDTFSWVGLDDLGIDSQQKQHAYQYQPTHTLSLRKLFRRLGILAGAILIDLGCGKGKPLLISAEFGFREARGVEISPSLCEIARRNCMIYERKRRTSTKFDIIHSDILDYHFQDDEDVFYLFNPFDAHVLAQVSECILASLQRRNRRAWVIYCTPTHRDTIEQKFGARVISAYSFWGQEFAVYEIEPRIQVGDETMARRLTMRFGEPGVRRRRE
jgi:SAM-dependent methyltransferase